MTSKFLWTLNIQRIIKSRVIVSIILDSKFWNDCLVVVTLMAPFMHLLRIVDFDERSLMGYVYEACIVFVLVSRNYLTTTKYYKSLTQRS